MSKILSSCIERLGSLNSLSPPAKRGEGDSSPDTDVDGNPWQSQRLNLRNSVPMPDLVPEQQLAPNKHANPQAAAIDTAAGELVHATRAHQHAEPVDQQVLQRSRCIHSAWQAMLQLLNQVLVARV
jgi:hypothetical protein